MTSKTNLTINPQRLWDTLMETAKFGGTPKGGIKRLTVSDEDKRVRDWFKAECVKLGCTVEVDEVGNMFATRPGKRKDMAPIAMGSHLDTQPTGGKFDGVLGVLGALEAWLVLTALGAHLSFADVWIMEAFVQSVRAASFFIPASLGAQEAAILVMVDWLLGAQSMGVATALVRRAREVLWIALSLLLSGLCAATPRRVAALDLRD